MITAEVEGLGTLEFPDETDPTVIQSTVKRMVSQRGLPQESTLDEPKGPGPSLARRVVNLLPELAYNFTLGPLVEAGKVLRGQTAAEQASGLAALTPEQAAIAKESGRGLMSPFSLSNEELMRREEPLFSAAMFGAGGHVIGGPRFGGTKTPLGFRYTQPAPTRPLLAAEIPPGRPLRPPVQPQMEVLPPETVLPASQVPPQAMISPEPIGRPLLEPPPVQPLAVAPGSEIRPQPIAGVAGPARIAPEPIQAPAPLRLTEELVKRGQVVEPTPAPEVTNRLAMIRRQVDDARTSLPTGKQVGISETGEVLNLGATPSIREQLSPLFPELRELPKVGPKEIIEAIDKDRGNKLYLAIKDAVEHQLGREAQQEAAALRPTDFDEFSRFVNEQAAQEPVRSVAGIPLREGNLPVAERIELLERAGYPEAAQALRKTAPSQPRMIEVAPSLSPEPLRAGAPQVPHEELLGGMRPMEPPPPELPLKPPSEGIVELHAGLPIPESVKNRVREFFKRPAVAGVASTAADLPPEKLAHFYNTGQTILNRAFPEQKLGDKLLTMRNWNDRFTAEYMMGMEKTPLKSLTEPELTNLMRAAEGRATPMNARVVQTLQEWKRLTGQDATLLTQQGAQVLKDVTYGSGTTGTKLREATWKPFAPVKDYYYRAVDDRLVVKMLPQDLATAISRANPTMSAPQAAEMAVGMRAQAKGQAIPSTVGEEAARILRRGQPQSAHLHERTGFVIPDEILQRPNVSMPAYMESMAKEKAALLTYGPKDAVMEAAIKAGQANPRPDTALGVEFWDQYRGRSIQGPSYQGIDQIQRILGNAATMMFLGGPTAIKQFSQVGLAAARLPIRSLAVGIKESFTKQGRFEARRFGSVVDDLRNDMIAARAQGGPQPAATKLDRLEMLTRTGANKVVNFWRIPKTDAFGRIVTFNGEKHRLLALQEKALSRDANAIAKLKTQGLSATSSLDDISLAAKRVADRVNLRTGPEEMPFILYKPGLTFFRHLNSFNIAITKTISQDYVAPLLRSVAKGDVVGTTKGLTNVVKLVAAMGVTGEVLGETLRTLAGRQEDRPGGSLTEFADDLVNGRVPANVILKRLGDDLMFSGMFGYLQVIKEGLLASGGPRESVARIGSAIGGAGVSNVVEMAAQAANVAAKELTGTEKQKASARMQAGRAVARRIPGAGAFVQPLLPATEQSDRRRATAAITRARRRGDSVEASEWQTWFRKRHGKSLSPASLSKAQQEY